jgi:cell division protein FtsB
MSSDSAYQSLQEATKPIGELIERNKALTEQNSILEKNLKTMSDAVDALTARINKLEKH